ncbi:prolyl oligopeptidase family serine peptidase [Occallatibacter savannae]|uniref:prolyl oligopeptidase family serine peptidase n=1 Tax=Occallatibacter savannae TaxID=1002691 RepID=UPI000D692A3A|nr:prolyl oligopeptidase family serine peptidase [Occallatibacter savannae]
MRRVAGCFFVVVLSSAGLSQSIRGRDGITLPAAPVVEPGPVVDDYFGTKVTDNYRWLENAKSPETRAFIDEENAYTTRYLKQARVRSQIVDDLDPLEHTTRWSIPMQRAGNYYFMKRLAGEEQGSIYVRRGWTGAAEKAGPKDERLVDPASFSRDKNTSVRLVDVSRDGLLVAYQVRQGGADESTIRVYSLTKKKALEDEIPAGVYYSVFFSPDGKGLYYARTDAKGTLLYLHTLGMRNSTDKLVFGREFHGELLGPIDLFNAEITDDDRYLVITIQRGVPPTRVDICFRDLKKPGAPFDVLVWGLDSRFSASYFKGSWYVKTDYSSPNYRILRADPGIMPEAWKTVIPEGKDLIESFEIVGGKLYVKRLHDVKSEISVYTVDGKPAGQVDLEGIGSASNVTGRTIDRYGFFSMESYIQPPTIYRIDTLTGKREVFAEPKTAFKTADYELKQVFFKSADGTQVPMFIAGKKGLKQDGSERLLMTGYGGFNLSETPAWSPAWAWWLEQGGWFAVPNLRGGGEYGQSWHEQGMFAKKQNVFDDWFAAARYLIEQKYTSAEHFAISGRSNGGLLMGASITQHPELFSAVWCGYPLLDMLRYQKFEQGPHWTTEYGSAEKQKDFGWIYKYSPYQNVKPRADYPAVMFFTGDSDTRVDPLHARKMTALLQAESKSGRPVLLHYSTTGGHSAGVSVEQQIQDDADQLTFLWTETGSSSKARQARTAGGDQP